MVPWGEMCTAELVPRDGGGRYLAVESGFGLDTGGEDDPWEAFKPRGMPAIELSSGAPARGRAAMDGLTPEPEKWRWWSAICCVRRS